MTKVIHKYSGVGSVVYLQKEPRLYALVQTKRGISLPGGGIDDKDNTLEDTLYREINEELGLLKEDIAIDEKDFEETFQYDKDKENRENQLVVRKIYLVRSKKDDLVSKDDEVINIDWYTYDEAQKKLTWDNAKNTLSKANVYLDSKL